jgi:hypothetical protein
MAMVAATEPRVRRQAKPGYLVTVDAFAYAPAALLVLLALQDAVDALPFPGVPAEQLPRGRRPRGELSSTAVLDGVRAQTGLVGLRSPSATARR